LDLIYTIGIYLYGAGIRIASIFNPRAKRWIDGRKGLFEILEKKIEETRDGFTATVWFHCASLGEFEQGRPVIEKFRETYPQYRIVLTFFSPSGYDVRKSYPGAEIVSYIPLDTPRNARKLIRMLNPAAVFFIKYEYWFNHLKRLKQQNIPVFIVSAVFRREQVFFRGYGKWFRKQLKDITWFFLQNERSKELLDFLGIKQYTLTGDTRFDRVTEVVNRQNIFPAVEKFSGKFPVIMGGSTWKPDEELIFSLIRQYGKKTRFIIVPHEVDPGHIRSVESGIPIPSSGKMKRTFLLYSGLTKQNAGTSNILIIDTIGILAHLYKYATLVIVGGGFGAGIHNILEAAAFGKPVIFGPRYEKFEEARELIRLGGAFTVNNREEMIRVVGHLLSDDAFYRNASRICSTFVENNSGATRRIIREIRELGFISPAAKISG
jgi:3-deoxy-D-manno-octulosonic-acid transferase